MIPKREYNVLESDQHQTEGTGKANDLVNIKAKGDERNFIGIVCVFVVK